MREKGQGFSNHTRCQAQGPSPHNALAPDTGHLQASGFKALAGGQPRMLPWQPPFQRRREAETEAGAAGQ